MNFEAAGERYVALKSQYENKVISAADFERSVKGLVVSTSDGKKWHIEPFTGTWVELGPGNTPPLSSQGGKNAPETLLQFFSFMLKGLVKNLPRIILVGLAMSVLTWVAHTYIVAKINDGLMFVSGNTTVNSVVHLQQTHFRGVNAFWGILAYFVSTFFMRGLSMGPKNWLNNIKQTPKHIQESFVRNGSKAIGALLIGIFLATFFVSIYRNFMLSWVLAFGFLLILTAHFQSVEITLLRLGLSDLQKFFGRNIVGKGEEYDLVYLGLLGMAGGFFLAGLMRTNFWFTFVFAVLALAAFILLQVKGVPKVAALLALAGGGALLFHDGSVYAWCEGGSFSQAGNWIEWWSMNNADLVRRLGLIPALSSFLGGGLGSAIVTIPQPPGAEGSTAGASPPGIDLPVNPADLGSPFDNPNTDFSGGDGPGSCSPYGLPNYWVNTATLNLVVRDTVFAAKGVGPPVSLNLTYNSDARTKGMFGRGWSFSYEWSLAENGLQIVLHKGSGQELTYTASSPGTAEQPSDLLPPAGISHRLISYGDYWLFHEQGSPFFQRFDRVPGSSLARLTAIKDYYGQKVQFGYNDSGNLNSVSDAAGRMIRFAYNGNGLCSSFTLPDGRQASFRYDGNDRLVQAMDLLEVNADYEYDADNYLVSMAVGRTRRTTSFTYVNKGGRKLVQTVTNANGNTTRYEMVSVEPRQVRVTDPGGKVTTYYSSGGLTEMVTDPAGHTVRYTYQDGRQVAFQDQNGHVTVREYDGQGRLLAETNPAGGRLSFSYDAAGNLVKINDSTDSAWLYRYDDRNKLVSITTPGGREKGIVYNEQGLIVEISGYDGTKTVFSHDSYGNITDVTDALGNVVSFNYDEYGYHKTAMTDQLGNSTVCQFDANGRPVQYIYPDGSEKSIGYDCCYPIMETDENGRNMVIERDGNGNAIRTFDQCGNASELGYDISGNPVYFRDELGRTTAYAYSEAGHLQQVTDPLGQRQLLDHDPAGNLTSLWVEGERRTFFNYDPNYQLISITDPLGARVSVERDVLGRITAIHNARGNRINLAYDPDSLLTAKCWDGAEVASYEYNRGGKIAKVKDLTGSTSFAYDNLGRLEKISYPGGFILAYRYDGAGNLSAVTYPGDLNVEYAYDSRNCPVSISWNGQYVKFAYDAAGNIIAEEHSNGTVSRFAYDNVGRMVNLTHGQGEALFIDRSYIRDAAGNILEERGILPVSPIRDSFFHSGCNGADQLQGRENGSFSYDADGNLVNAGEVWSGSYDPENRLVELQRGDSSTTFAYNGLGQRVQVTDKSGTRNYYYNLAGTLQFETDQRGEIVRFYLYCGGRLIAAVEPDGKTLFYHFDQAGNTLALTGADGEVVAAYAYSPFGLRAETGAAGDNPLTYSGCFGVMSEKGGSLYFMQHRSYDAELGRFLQKDPLGIEGGVNLYAYAGNNPLKYVDPAGTLLMEAYLLLKVTGKVVGIATTVYGVGSAGYTAADSTYAFTQVNKTRNDARSAWKDYRDGNFSSAQAEEAAYQRYVDAYNRYQDISDRAWGGPERVTNTVAATTAELAIPDVAQVPYQGTKYALTKDSKCGFTQSTSKNLRPNKRLTQQDRQFVRAVYGR